GAGRALVRVLAREAGGVVLARRSAAVAGDAVSVVALLDAFDHTIAALLPEADHLLRRRDERRLAVAELSPAVAPPALDAARRRDDARAARGKPGDAAPYAVHVDSCHSAGGRAVADAAAAPASQAPVS